jgi:hypothetical protein
MPEWRPAIPIAAGIAVIAGAIVTDVLLSACALNQTAPSPPAPQALTVTVGATGVSPVALTGPRATVDFVNRDTEVHDIRSNPHPNHSDCPELNVGRIAPGQRVSILTPLESGRRCGYHDETAPDDVRFQGTIVIN